jgi:hypothetical protein
MEVLLNLQLVPVARVQLVQVVMQTLLAEKARATQVDLYQFRQVLELFRPVEVSF